MTERYCCQIQRLSGIPLLGEQVVRYLGRGSDPRVHLDLGVLRSQDGADYSDDATLQ